MKELTALLDKAEDYFKKAEEKRPPPGRLNYVHIPKTKEEAERAHKIAHAVGDAQVWPHCHFLSLSPSIVVVAYCCPGSGTCKTRRAATSHII